MNENEPLSTDVAGNKETAPTRTISLADANLRFGFIHCLDCGVGGHTGHTLYKVVKSVVTGEEGSACAQHIGKYIRPKNLKRRKR